MTEIPPAGAEGHAEPQADPTPSDAQPETAEGEPDTFPREYVTQLRDEAKGWRQKAAAHDETKARLHVELVRATGRLADPFDLSYDEAHLTDPDKLQADLDALITAKPHFASRKPVPGSGIGQGQQGSPVAPKPGLIDAIRAKQGR